MDESDKKPKKKINKPKPKFKITKQFWGVLVFMILIFLSPTAVTLIAKAEGLGVIYGFPLPVYIHGGSCMSDLGKLGDCGSFSIPNFFVDLILILGVPFVINLITLKTRTIRELSQAQVIEMLEKEGVSREEIEAQTAKGKGSKERAVEVDKPATTENSENNKQE